MKPEVIEVEKPRPSPCPVVIPGLDLPTGSSTDYVEQAQHGYIRELRRLLSCWIVGGQVNE